MHDRFTAQEWWKLTAKERIHLCRLMAAESRELAHVSESETRAGYLRLARQWEALASEIEPDSQVEATPPSD